MLLFKMTKKCCLKGIFPYDCSLVLTLMSGALKREVLEYLLAHGLESKANLWKVCLPQFQFDRCAKL